MFLLCQLCKLPFHYLGFSNGRHFQCGYEICRPSIGRLHFVIVITRFLPLFTRQSLYLICGSSSIEISNHQILFDWIDHMLVVDSTRILV